MIALLSFQEQCNYTLDWMKKHAQDYVWHFDFESLLLSRSRGFRMERASDITKTGTIRFSLCVLFFQGGSSICRSRAIPTSGKMMVISYVSSIYPIISASHRSDYDSYVSYQELRSQWPDKWSVSSLNFCQDLTYHISLHPHSKHWLVVRLKTGLGQW